MLVALSIVAAVVIASLCWILYRRVGASRIDTLVEKRRATSRMVSTADYIDETRHVKVALALTNTDLFYDNGTDKAFLDLGWIQEIEYGTRLASGQSVDGGKILRIRCFSQQFEFVLADAVVPRWHMMLPPRRRTDLAFAPPVALPVPVATKV